MGRNPELFLEISCKRLFFSYLAGAIASTDEYRASINNDLFLANEAVNHPTLPKQMEPAQCRVRREQHRALIPYVLI
jgi:hypothetical protein